jgi:hypothetical protein
MDDSLFSKAAEEAFPEYNVKHMIPVELPDHSGKVFFFAFFLLLTQISMSDGIVQNNCCQRKFCEYFLLLEELCKIL